MAIRYTPAKDFDPDKPQPGLYLDVPFDVYLSAKAVNNSDMKNGIRSDGSISIPHYLAKRGTTKDTASLSLGRLAHACKLQPDKVHSMYTVRPDFANDDANVTKDGKPSTSGNTDYCRDSVAGFTKTAKLLGQEVVTQEELDRMLGMMRGLSGDGDARALLDGDGPTEVTLIWRDSVTRIPCKARPDKVLEATREIPDLKSTVDVSDFGYSSWKFGYFRQAAHYTAGMEDRVPRVLGEEPWSMPLVAVESSTPYTVATGVLCIRSLLAGADQRTRFLDTLRKWLEGNRTPSERPKLFSIPGRYMMPEPLRLG